MVVAGKGIIGSGEFSEDTGGRQASSSDVECVL